MPTEIPFWKMHGAGNDFILVDDRMRRFPGTDTAWLARIGARRTGVGCDGIMLIQESDCADLKMVFFNPDGSPAGMCGNGARCVARLARELGIAGEAMSIETGAGLVRAECLAAGIRLHLTPPRDWVLERALDVDGERVCYSAVNTGVPHVVIDCEDVDRVDIAAVAPRIRGHAAFQPQGTNVNYAALTGPSALAVRTYERGVEAETLACGTGIVAAAVLAGLRGRLRPPVRVMASSGDTLEVDFRLTTDGPAAVTLLGPAAHVFRGTLLYPAALGAP
ncbi:MAG: diaminopimelate epimerase [Kiritimatiellae bacterium]|nr:diaminopimelate epimerase [Kiritimatiellia bacterium]